MSFNSKTIQYCMPGRYSIACSLLPMRARMVLLVLLGRAKGVPSMLQFVCLLWTSYGAILVFGQHDPYLSVSACTQCPQSLVLLIQFINIDIFSTLYVHLFHLCVYCLHATNTQVVLLAPNMLCMLLVNK